MILIFEGPDNVGKTTQIKQIMKRMIDKPTYIIHFSGIPGILPEASREYSKKLYTDMFYMMTHSVDNNRHLIFDRAHLGEYVYAPIYRKYSGEFIFDIENDFQYTAAFQEIKLFVFVDSAKNLINREDGNSFSVDPDIKNQEVGAFVDAFNKTLIKQKYLININGQSIDDVYHTLTKIIFNA